jgi:hypothetical protein
VISSLKPRNHHFASLFSTVFIHESRATTHIKSGRDGLKVLDLSKIYDGLKYLARFGVGGWGEKKRTCAVDCDGLTLGDVCG